MSSTAQAINDIQKKTGIEVQHSDAESVLRGLRELNARLQDPNSKDFSTGDQLVIAFDAHGELNRKTGEHELQLADGMNSVTGAIEETVLLAEKKGLRVAVLLASCYSGNAMQRLIRSLNLSKTCIVHSSVPDRIAYTGAFFHLSKNLRKASSLEQAFLEARRNLRNVPYQPGISSPAGIRTMHELALIKNYKYSVVDSPRVYADRLCNDESYTAQRFLSLINLAKKIDLSLPQNRNRFWEWNPWSPDLKERAGRLQKIAADIDKVDATERRRLDELNHKIATCPKVDEKTLSAAGVGSNDQFCQLVRLNQSDLDRARESLSLIQEKMRIKLNPDPEMIYYVQVKSENSLKKKYPLALFQYAKPDDKGSSPRTRTIDS